MMAKLLSVLKKLKNKQKKIEAPEFPEPLLCYSIACLFSVSRVLPRINRYYWFDLRFLIIIAAATSAETAAMAANIPKVETPPVVSTRTNLKTSSLAGLR